MNKPIIVGIDGSRHSREALRWAADFGRTYGIAVEALTVWETPQGSEYPVFALRRFEADAKADLRSTVESEIGEGSSLRLRTERGDPAERLVEAASQAQLLVVGTRGRSAVMGALLGSVSQYCLAHAPCPVVIVRHND